MTIKNSKFNFIIYGYLNKPDPDGFLTIDVVEVKDAKSSRTIQTIKSNAKFDNPNRHPFLKVIDINYDGNEDFILLSGNGQYRDTIYDFYIFNPALQQFERWTKEFNDGKNIINVRPEFDESNKTITTYWHNTDTYQKTSIFKFHNGDYELIEEYNQELDKETNNKYLVVTRKKMIEGKFRLIELEMIPLNGKD